MNDGKSQPEAIDALRPVQRVRVHGFQGCEKYARKVSGRIWPCGDISVGPVPARRDTPASEEDITYWSDGDIAAGLGPWSGAERLDLSNLSKSHRPPPRAKKRGTSGITSFGRKMVKSAGCIIKRRWPRHRITFCTVTMPAMQAAQRRVLVEHWPELVRQILQTVNRGLKRRGLPPIVLSVSEVQPQRLAKHGEGYLHLHLIWLNVPAKSGKWSITPNSLRSMVSRFLFSRIPGFDGGFVNVDTRPVKASIAAYMSKYMSKGAEVLGEAIADWGEDCCIKQWWNMSGELRTLVKSEILHGPIVGELLESTVNWALCNGVNEIFHWLRHIEIDLDGSLVTIGWRGWMKDGPCEDLRELLKSA